MGVLGEVLGAHEPAMTEDVIYCQGCDWERYYDRTGPPDSWSAHVEAALLAHLVDVLGSDETREVVAEALSVREMTEWHADAHEDHNRWSWRGDGHGAAIRDGFRAEADAALAAVREVLGLPGGDA